MPYRSKLPLASRGVAALLADRQGGVAVTFALSLLVLLGFAGAAIDYSRASEVKTYLAAAADSAALAAAKEAQLANARGERASEVERKAKLVGDAVLRNAVERITGFSPGGGAVDVDVSAEPPTARANQSGTVDTTVSRLFQRNSIAVNGHSVVRFDMAQELEVYLFLDVSASMKLGATHDSIERLKTATTCAFACHDGNKRASLGDRDSFEWALANGVQLRFQAVNAAVTALLDHIRRQDPGGTKVRVALYGFNEQLTKLSDLTTNFDAIRTALPKVPSGQTAINKLIPDMADVVGGAGREGRSTRKLVIIATDGAENTGKVWTVNVPERVKVGSVKGSKCNAFKKGVQVAVLHTPYLPMPWDWGYEATLGQPSQEGGPGKRVDDIAPQLRGCATDGLYIDAFDAAAIREAGVRLYTAATPIRISH